ncbi:adenylate/guanylate cyclase domain-containing protein [Microbacterium sp. H1-D42]|uniref:adenylate/guanylate cyclase domain-containing protein n=1 Tax=Microbacterium sp. H1-D42 TaxID=2925844 RepID=UPI001F53415B|nr:adenylate/guanylate cyclase domain-containing protein [Microbacterium sp. H1-D42]UNK70801.1 adenylate/guanylate cyclase domain-containing protein [Microbacterium sp. H1-D42]
MVDGTHTAEERAKARRRRRGGLSIQSKLLIMLLGVSLVSSVIVGAVGFINGRQSLHESAIDQLTTIRELRTYEMVTAIEDAKRSAALNSRNLSAQNASVALNEGFEDLQDRELDPAQFEVLENYHRDVFIPELEKRSDDEYGDTAFIPASAAGRWLQAHYTVQNEDLDEDYDSILKMNNAGDGTAYSTAAERYGDYFGRLIDQAGYEDVLMLNLDGDVVFSAYKGIDLGTNLNDGPYDESALANAYRAAVTTNSVNTTVMTDFERWIPSLDVPAMWVLSPIGNDSQITGVLAMQLPLSFVNTVMTGGEKWKEQGLGSTGEVYLVGRDDTMRSTSRELVEHPDDYAQSVIDAGTPPSIAKRAVEVGGTVLLQPVRTEAVEQAQRGKEGTSVGPGYISGETVVSYGPLDVPDLDWVVVARITADEAFAPTAEFTRTVLISLLGIILAVALLSLLLAQVFTRPVHRLVGAVNRVAEGDLDVQVPQGSRDEFGDLGSAFNDMASSLRIKQQLIDEQRSENQKLMHTLMPESMAAKYRAGDEAISEAHDNVSVVFAELVGFDDYARELSTDDEVAQLNVLMRGFDEAAATAGVEKVRTLHEGYLASSGLIVPRVDNVRRSVEFARSLLGVVERFNAQNGADIALRVGVDAGTVTSGLVARTSLAYDLWGDAVNLAYRVRSITGEPGIYVSQDVRDRTQELFTYVEAGVVEVKGHTETVWKVV